MEVLPEMRAIDSLVVRDFYHRYTVDEHSLRTIEHLQALAEPPDGRGMHFAPLWKTLERRDLLILAMLLHDVGKGMAVENHVTGQFTALESAASRLGLTPEEEAEVRFLIEHHLDMSATVQRRDIFDPGTVSAFADTVGTLERLQRLCLLTYADIHAVNPEALTPWKAEMLWQLFVATANHFSRTWTATGCTLPTKVSCSSKCSAEAGGARKRDRAVPGGFPAALSLRALGGGNCRALRAVSQTGQRAAANRIESASATGFSLTLLTADRPRCLPRLPECWLAGE